MAGEKDCKEKDKGVYTISIILKDVNGKESSAATLTLVIEGFTTPTVVIAFKIKPKVNPAPVATIVKMTNRGLVHIEWNRDMRVPTKNKLKSIPTDVE